MEDNNDIIIQEQEHQVVTHEEVMKEEIKPNKKKNKKAIIIITSVLLIIAIGAGITFTTIQKKKKEISDYSFLIKSTISSMWIDVVSSEILCSKISDTWREAIYSDDNKDFNTEITTLKSGWESSGIYKKKEESNTKIKTDMKKLKNPPKVFAESYKMLLELYGVYGQLYEQATSPSGTLQSYRENITNKDNRFKELYDKIKVSIPEVKIPKGDVDFPLP